MTVASGLNLIIEARPMAFQHTPREVLRLLGLAILTWALGCTPASPECTMAPQSIKSGFKDDIRGLFVSEGRLGQLLRWLGYDPDEFSHGCDHSPDGQSVRLWNYGRTRAVVIRKGIGARSIRTPPGAHLDDQDALVAWYGRGASNHRVKMASGDTIFAPGFHVDGWGEWFCYGGDYYDYVNERSRSMPVRIARIDAPYRVVVESDLPGILAGLYSTEDVLLIVTRSNDARRPNALYCEEYEPSDDILKRRRRFELRCPSGLLAANFVPKDFDPESLCLLLSVSRDLPLGDQLWYCFELKTGRMQELGVSNGYMGFLDPGVFDTAIQQLRNCAHQQAAVPNVKDMEASREAASNSPIQPSR